MTAVVVGAGAGGLVAAWELARGGCDVTVIEAAERPGGLLAVADLAGLAVDVGAEGYSVRGGSVAALLHDLGADELITRPDPLGAWLQTEGGVHPIPKQLVFGLPADPSAADVRAVVGDVPPGGPATGTLAEVVRAGYGERVLRDLVTPLVGGVYSTSPDQVTFAELAPWLASRVDSGTPLREVVAAAAAASPEGGAVHGIRGGMNRLADLLVRAGEAASGAWRLSCGERVTQVRRAGSGWRVRTSERDLPAAIVVLALPLHVAAKLLGAPAVPEPTAIEVVSALLSDPGLSGETPRGTGVLVGAGVPRVRAKALTHSTAKWAWLREAAHGRDIVRLSYGRRGEPPVTAGLAEPELRELVRSDAAALFGRPVPEPEVVRRTAWSILPPGTPGLSLAREWLTGQRTATLGLVGAGFAGVGMAAVVPHARAEIARLTSE